MEGPIRKHHDFFPRMFKAFTLYFVITLSVFFGYVQIFGDVKPNVITIPTDGADAENDTLFGNFVEKIAEFDNIDTDFDLTLENSEFSLSAQGNVVYDLGSGDLSLDVDLIYNQQYFDVQVSYVSPNVYLSIDESTYKFDASEDLDLSSLLDFVMNNIEIDTSFIEDIGNYLGIDLVNFDPNSLLTKLKIEESQNEENGEIIFVIGLGNNLSARMVCDSEFNIKSIKLKDMFVAGSTVKFSADVNKMNKDDVVVDYIETGDEVDMSGITLYKNYAKNLFANDFVMSNVAISVDNETYYANVYLDNSNSTKVKIETSLKGVDVSLVYSDNVIYVDVANLKLSFNAEDYPVWEDTINEILEKHTSKTVSQIVSEFVSQYVGIDEEGIDGQQVLMQILGIVFDNAESVSDYLPSSTEMTEDAFSMIWNNGLVINLNGADNQLVGINVMFDKVDIDAKFEIVEKGFEVDGNYYDLSNLLPLSNVVDEILGTNQFGGQAGITFNDFVVKANYVVDFSNGILAKISTQIFGENVSIYLNNNQIFISVGEVVVEGNIDDLENYIAKIDSIFGTDLTNQVASSDIEVGVQGLIGKLSEILNELKLAESEGVIALIEYLANKAYIWVDGNNVVLTFENQTISAEVYVGATYETISLPSATDKTDDVLNKIENVKNYIDTKQYAFEFAVSYDEMNLSGAIQIDLKNSVFAIYGVEIGGNELAIIYSDNTAYVDYAGLKIKLQAENLAQIFEIVNAILKANGMNDNVDVSVALTEIFEENVEELSLQELLSMIEIDVAGSLDELKLDLKFDSESGVYATGDVGFVDDMIESVDLLVNEKISINLNVVPFETSEISDSEYYDLTSVNKGTVTLSYQKGDEKVDVVADVEIALTDKIYVKLSAKVLNEKFEVIIYNNMLYAQVGDLCFATNFENAKELYDYIVDLFAIAIPEVDIENVLKDVDLNLVNIFDVAGLSVLGDNEKLQVEYAINENLKVSLNIFDGQTIEEIVVPEQYEDLKVLLPKIKALIDYASKGVFEFDFSLAYNTLTFDGTFKYFDGNFEISNMVVLGENVLIRLQGKTLYFAFGNMKLKFDLTDTSTSSVDIFETLNKITSDSLGVVIDFGVFEELLNIATAYTLEDYLNKIILDISGNSELINILISNKKEYTASQILSVGVAFNGNDLSKIDLNIYDVIKAQLSLRKTDVSTISEFVEEDYKDYSENFVDGILNSLKVEEGVYAFNSDISIRYSNNQFYGELVAMLVESENGVVGNYMPAVSLHTTSLGLNSYIYLIGKDIYIDINGLQVTADLSETTINEIIDFLEQNFGLSLTENAEVLEATTEVFKVILPAFDRIYGTWVSGDVGDGLQIDIDSDLWYTESARFYDIVVQAFVQNIENTIVPTKIVVGANIEDENTTTYNDYSEYWLKDGEIVIESEITQKLNFAVYLTNVIVGKNVEGLEGIFVGESYQSISALKSNFGTTKLEEYNSYEVALDAAKAVYDYAMSLQYQARVDVTIKGENSTKIGANVIASVTDDVDKKAQFKLFDDKILKVHGDLDIYANYGTQNEVLHQLSILYDNLETGLFATYSHGDHIGVNDFKAKISNANMSEIISMIVKFADLNLSKETMEALNLSECPTDFRYLRSLLGMTKHVTDGEISEVDKVLSSVTEMTKILKEIKLEKVQIDGTDLFETRLSLKILWEEEIAQIIVLLREEKSTDGAVNLALREISISNFNFGGSKIDVVIYLEDYDETNYDYDTSAEHIDFSEISSFMNVAVNTLNTQGFSFTGSADVAIGSWNAITVNYDLFVSLDDVGEVYFYLELDVPSFADITYDLGGFGSTFTYYSAAAGFDNRISVLEFKDGILNVTQTTYGYRETIFSSRETRVKSWTHSADQIGTDIMLIMAEALGLTDTIYDAIKGLIASMNPNPSLEETILGFSKTNGGYTLSLDGETLTGSDSFRDFDVILGLSDTYYDLDGKSYQFIDSVTTDINIADFVKIPVKLQSTNSGTSYLTGYGKEIYTNDYYRKISIDESRYQKVYFVNSYDAEFNSSMLVSGDKVIFPNLTTREETIDNMTTYYQFDGWYTDSTYKNPVVGDVYMGSEELMFYAKWIVTKVVKTSAVNVYDGETLITTLRVESGDTIDLSGLSVVNEDTEFYYDAEYTRKIIDFVMPENDLNVYIRNKYTVTVVSDYGNAGFVYTGYQGEAISLPEQQTYVEDDGETRVTYTFLGWSEEISSVPNKDITITANWDVDVKHYYTISFDLRWYIVAGTVAGGAWKDEPPAIASETFLEGTVIDLTQEKYQVVGRAYTSGVRPGKYIDLSTKAYFKATSWGTSSWGDYTSAGSGFTSFEVTGNQTLYACWEKQ